MYEETTKEKEQGAQRGPEICNLHGSTSQINYMLTVRPGFEFEPGSWRSKSL